MSWRENLNVGNLNLENLMSQTKTRHTADGLIDPKKMVQILDGSSVALSMEMTPEDDRFYMLACVDASNAVTVTLQGSWTFDGSSNVATFSAGDGLIALADEANDMLILLSNNGVVLS